jgi:hypothetical protein
MLKELLRRDYRRQNLRWVIYENNPADLKVTSMKLVFMSIPISSWQRLGYELFVALLILV